MTNTRAARLGAIIAVAWLLVLSVADLAAPPDIVPDPLFALAPLAVAAVMSARATAGFAAAAVALVVLSGLYNQNWDTAQQWVLLLDVVLVGAAAVVIAEVRVRRERRFGHVATIAEVAQRAVLPTLPSAAADVRVTARYQSAVEDALVGGDLYDCSLVGARVRFLVGDVRGKGLAAVEQAARVIRAFRQAAATETELPTVARDMDAYLTPFMGDEDFATALLVDASHRDRVTLLACGHPPPMLIRPDGTAELLTVPPGLPLGLGAGGEAVTVSWGTGDRLLLYTDGLSEARDEQGRFLPLLDLAPTLTASQPDVALDGVLEIVRGHVKGGQLGDDLAIVLLENTAGKPHASAPGESQSASREDDEKTASGTLTNHLERALVGLAPGPPVRVVSPSAAKQPRVFPPPSSTLSPGADPRGSSGVAPQLRGHASPRSGRARLRLRPSRRGLRCSSAACSGGSQAGSRGTPHAARPPAQGRTSG